MIVIEDTKYSIGKVDVGNVYKALHSLTDKETDKQNQLVNDCMMKARVHACST